MKRVSQLILLALLLALTSFVLSARNTDALIVVQQSDAKTLDPSGSSDAYSSNVNLNLYDRLFDYNTEMKITPSLAESYRQLDELTLQVVLKKGVKFHNGDELTAEDVKFSLERAASAPAALTYFGNVEKVEIVDPYTVNIVTKKPYGPLLNSLANALGSIVNKKYVESAGPEAFFKPVGTGPFIFESWKAGDRISLKTNKAYFNGPSKVDGLLFRVIPESTNRTIALETGEVDIVLTVSPVDADAVEKNDHLKMYRRPSAALNYMGLNCEKGATADIRVRQAIAAALNLSDVNIAFGRLAIPAYSVIPPDVLGYVENPEPKQNLEKAKKLLAEAGYKDGLKLKFWTNENSARKDAAVIMQAQLKEAGILIDIEILEFGAYLERLNKGEHDLYLLGTLGSTDPDGSLYSLLHSGSKGSGGNRSFYANKTVDENLDLGRSSTDIPERTKAYQKVAEIAKEEIPVVPLVYPPVSVGAQDYIEGFYPYPTFTFLFKDVTKIRK
ncbi:MAG: ABC transporter substrate-binding protein [Fusobacteriaceae bacterium]|jgi:peptide/nickel transport system substrate-binding protein|nr:ABC transporter substrate-binding protein [Fusobacteriaceae bacterium]